MNSPTSTRRGFVALLSVVIISTLLTVIIISSSQLLFFTHTSLAEEESYQSALLQTVSCARLAAQSLSVDSSRFKDKIPSTMYLNSDDTCVIDEITIGDTTLGMGISSKKNSSFAHTHFFATRVSIKDYFKLVSMSPETN